MFSRRERGKAKGSDEKKMSVYLTGQGKRGYKDNNRKLFGKTRGARADQGSPTRPEKKRHLGRMGTIPLLS